MTVDDFIARIGNIGEEIDQIANRALAVAGPIVADLKQNAPAKTGSLKSSIGIGVSSGTEIFITMKDYGYFQNYGVQASPDSKTASKYNQREVEPAVRFALPPSTGNKFSFGVKKGDTKPFGAFYSGLNAVGFFSMAEIQRRLVEGLNEEMNAIARTT